MRLPAEIAVPVEVRALDAGPRVERFWRLALAIGEDGLRLERGLPEGEGRPVRVQLTLPGDPSPIAATGRLDLDRDAVREGEERPPAALVVFTDLAPEHRERIARYVRERTLAP